MTEKERACCFTGHRRIRKEEIPALSQSLRRVIEELLLQGVTDFYVGGALGFDTLAAEVLLAMRKEGASLQVRLAIPCKGQDAHWTKSYRERYQWICEQADEVIVLADRYDSGCMMRRNRFLVDHCGHCVFYLTNQRSGTWQTVKYAMEEGLALYNIFYYEEKDLH